MDVQIGLDGHAGGKRIKRTESLSWEKPQILLAWLLKMLWMASKCWNFPGKKNNVILEVL